MDLLLWRHAEAEDLAADGSDLARRLTPKGRQQAAAVAHWLKQRGPREARLLVSPALRTQETAQAFDRPFEICAAIAPGASAGDLIRASGWPKGPAAKGGAVILVGHQPTLGQLAAHLMTGRSADWAVKKGALWWLQCRARGGQEETILKLVLPPELA